MVDRNEALRLADELDHLDYDDSRRVAAFLREQAVARAMDTFGHNVMAGRAQLQMVRLESRLQSVTAERDQLRAEVERLRADAERYQWLADCENFYEAICLIANPSLTAHDLGNAIDAARTTHKDEA